MKLSHCGYELFLKMWGLRDICGSVGDRGGPLCEFNKERVPDDQIRDAFQN